MRKLKRADWAQIALVAILSVIFMMIMGRLYSFPWTSGLSFIIPATVAFTGYQVRRRHS